MSSIPYSLAYTKRKKEGLGKRISDEFINNSTDKMGPTPVSEKDTNDKMIRKPINQDSSIVRDNK